MIKRPNILFITTTICGMIRWDAQGIASYKRLRLTPYLRKARGFQNALCKIPCVHHRARHL